MRPPDVLHVGDVDSLFPDDEVLIRIRASTVSQSDAHIRGAHPRPWRLVAGWRRPRWRSLGVEFAGEVEAVGSAVREFHVGDGVFGSRWFNIHAEFICMPDTAALVHKPAALTFEEAAAIYDGGSQALATLQGRGRARRRLVIYGASGSSGPRRSRSPSTSART